ncbi:MAG: SurA N-terminal domain-containing protein [Spirochaetes bacterium]|nr:SurA N-terminal domain-containing protein [Spirochaetota bacterium]
MTFFKQKALIILTLFIFTLPLFSQRILMGDDKVAKVNNAIITLKELKEQYEQVRLIYISQGMNPPTEKEVLELMIDDKLKEQEIKKSSIILNEAAFKQQLDFIKSNFLQYMLQQNPKFQYSDDKFISYIEQEQKISYDEFIEKLEIKVKFEQEIGKRVEGQIQALRTKTYSDAELSKIRSQNIQQFVIADSVELKHIFILTVDPQTGKPLQGTQLQTQTEKAKDCYDRLKKGEDFNKICNIYSDDEATKIAKNPMNGKTDPGYIGYISWSNVTEKEKSFIQQFGNSVYNKISGFKKGTFTEMIQGKYGYHIFYVLDKVTEKILTLDETRLMLTAQLREYDYQKILLDENQKYMKELRKRADIKYYKEEYK